MAYFCFPDFPVESKTVFILVDLPGGMILSVGSATVHPHEARTFLIFKLVSPTFSKINSFYTFWLD